MDYIHSTIEYLKYKRKAHNLHGLHSPFVYKLYEEIIGSEKNYYFFTNAEILRAELLINEEVIEKIEFGTGSKKNKLVSINNIAKTSLKSSKEAQFLFKLINYLQPKNIVEIGTCLGLTTSYIAAANSKSKVISIEGCPNTLAIAQQNLNKLRIKNVTTICGNFDDVLPQVISDLESVDFVFFDGNHRYQATINYFEMCLAKVNNNTVFVFDDIHWSKEMTEAWNEIKAHKLVTVTIDLFSVGIVLFRKEQAKENFILKF